VSLAPLADIFAAALQLSQVHETDSEIVFAAL